MTHTGLEQLKTFVSERRNKIKQCPCCGSSVKDRKVALYKELIDALYRVYCWCGKHRTHEFEMHQIKDLLGKNEYARFGDLVRFGGLVYKPKEEGMSRKALYGINMARAKEFFKGERDIPVQITLNQITNEIIDEQRAFVNEFPSLKTFISAHGLYDYEMEPGPKLFQ